MSCEITFEIVSAALSEKGEARAVNCLRTYLQQFAKRLGASQTLAEDCAQIAFIKLLKGWRNRGPSMFTSEEANAVRAFLKKTVRNTLIDELKRLKDQASLSLEAGNDSSSLGSVANASGPEFDEEGIELTGLRNTLEALHQRVIERSPALAAVLDQVWRSTVDESDLDNDDLLDRSEWQQPDVPRDEQERRRRTALNRLQQQHSRWRRCMVQEIERCRAQGLFDDESLSLAQRFVNLSRQRRRAT